MYLLSRLTELGLDVREDILHKLVYRMREKGVKIELYFMKVDSEGLIFSHELSRRLERLAKLGYIKRFLIVSHSYEELYKPVYKISDKGLSILKRIGISQRDKKIIDEIVREIKTKLERAKVKRGV